MPLAERRHEVLAGALPRRVGVSKAMSVAEAQAPRASAAANTRRQVTPRDSPKDFCKCSSSTVSALNGFVTAPSTRSFR
jgi:hypothetical protein